MIQLTVFVVFTRWDRTKFLKFSHRGGLVTFKKELVRPTVTSNFAKKSDQVTVTNSKK